MNIDILNQLSGNIGWKDSQLQHLGCNRNLADALQMKYSEDIVGLKDKDLPNQSEQDLQFHFDNDQHALLGKSVNVIHIYQQSVFFITKKPLHDNNKDIIGVIYHCHKLQNSAFYLQLKQSDEKYFPGNHSHYKTRTTHNPFHLSQRENECMFHLLRGKTSKQIADILNLSKRTIDFYIENIKNKAGCRTKSELLITAIESGYTNIIP